MNATHSYFILNQTINDENCLIDDLPRPLKKTAWAASEGIRMGDTYPSGVRLQMSNRFRGMVVPDLIPNTLLKHMVSGRLKALLEKEAGVEIEFLSFALYNHKGRVAAQDCFIANVIGTQDCADMAKTEGEPSIISPGKFEALFKLALDPERVPPEARLFRLEVMPRVLVIRDDLRSVLEQNGITGIQYIAMGEQCRVV
ncbi:hypothetical protein HPC49_36135 [Pyxidicoccus fallax]|uniref:Immunity MXAN-0049 protein domain-containing protein n=1 Tax=Pyxidicoccus fallax TaxID=394095 RepID=A0A848LXM3_9BACT|nr:DUF1629 domain-containing protein [Pyxidicoccus fallax]NMO22133.1 hypothetical protein [Pyxidicoccus fallax]NPC83641.1 hypothetical protein [Pyxidicoccus fallax]